MFERYTDRARRIVVLAQEVARESNYPDITTAQLLVAIRDENEGGGAQALAAVGATKESLRDALWRLWPPYATPLHTGHLPFTPGMKRSLELALREALALSHPFIAGEHLLLGLLRSPDNDIASLLEAAAIDWETLRVGALKAAESIDVPRRAQGEDLTRAVGLLEDAAAILRRHLEGGAT
jgi:ATP-dependent Clp protease ATP-binding subunit ClpC